MSKVYLNVVRPIAMTGALAIKSMFFLTVISEKSRIPCSENLQADPSWNGVIY